MNKNRLGFAWLLLTVIMVGMSLSPMIDNPVLSASENVDSSTEIVANEEKNDQLKDWSQEEQTNNDEGDVRLSDSLLSNGIMNIGSRDNVAEIVEVESPLDSETNTESRIVDTACTGDFNLDLDGDADLLDDHDLKCASC